MMLMASCNKFQQVNVKNKMLSTLDEQLDPKDQKPPEPKGPIPLDVLSRHTLSKLKENEEIKEDNENIIVSNKGNDEIEMAFRDMSRQLTEEESKNNLVINKQDILHKVGNDSVTEGFIPKKNERLNFEQVEEEEINESFLGWMMDYVNKKPRTAFLGGVGVAIEAGFMGMAVRSVYGFTSDDLNPFTQGAEVAAWLWASGAFGYFVLKRHFSPEKYERTYWVDGESTRENKNEIGVNENDGYEYSEELDEEEQIR